MACSAATCKQQRHALAIPLPGQGHVIPLLRFCKRLASRAGFIITFVDIPIGANPNLHVRAEQESTGHPDDAKHKHEHNADACKGGTADMVAPVQTASASHDAMKLNIIRRVSIPLKMPELREGMIETFFRALESLPPLIEELLCRLNLEDPPITCLISDLFMTGFTQKIADKFSIPRVAFHTGSQSWLVFKNHILEGTIPFDQVLKVVASKDVSKDDTFVEGVLGLPTLSNGDLLDYHDDNAFMYARGVRSLKETKERAHAIVVNTFKDLEEPALKVNIGDKQIYAVGPLIEPLDKDTSTYLWKEDYDCILWLSEQPCLSVLYISFGSFATLSKAQFEEIIAGLISSQQRFLWVLRPDLVTDASYSTLHAHLLSQSHGRGYLSEWAPQTRVLSHPSVGGFFTHCGWNSTIEAITWGVPMLCFPYMSDQFINAKFVTQEWKIGLGFKVCQESGLVKRDEVERVICTLMVREEGKALYRKAHYFKEIAHQNCQLKSTSLENFQALVDSLQ